ncbi:NADH-quinone oxidoreductase subunit E [Jhaorihella thermophila]|uniref:NADH-quinone oxidoreductase subunit E n=1 Tax=Jhaorihella thermophila TaxID=488547 RepID=A0A1H5S6B2_9RHOB|nr:NADH-quinone oxidoreductase subunit E [Jhaorihella thermophila]SEF45311.1 NADH-quinone oxidoreductase subunit E [Jhaorihella thermophila]
MLRRLYHEQPDSFAFTPANLEWAKAQITKYPEGRQASAIIPLLWRAQEQEGWLTRPAIEYVADFLGMPYIRALEVATFYFMFQLQPVGSVAHIQICGTTTCMICGSGALIEVCKRRIAEKPHTLSADGKFSWEEVECLGACSNAPMAQIGKDYYEDLTPERFEEILDDLAAGKVPVPGPQNGRYAAEPLGGLTALKEFESGRTQHNATVELAVKLGDTVKRIDGTEVPILTPWLKDRPAAEPAEAPAAEAEAKPAAPKPAEAKAEEPLVKPSKPLPGQQELAARKGEWKYEVEPETLSAPRDGKPDDLKLLKGVGPKLEKLLNELGFYHFDQIAAWTPEQVAWVDERLSFKGRIEREGWIEQARELAAKKK